jgi:hypothetical protein
MLSKNYNPRKDLGPLRPEDTPTVQDAPKPDKLKSGSDKESDEAK